MTTYREQLSDIFRTIEADRGTTSLSNLLLIVLNEIFDHFKPISVDDFYHQFKGLVLLVKTTKPRIGIIIFHFCQIWDEIQYHRDSIQTLPQLKRVIQRTIDLLTKEAEKDNKKLIINGGACINDNDSILIHSHSRTVLKIVEKAYRHKKKIRIVLAEQEEEKTQDMIHFFQEREIPFIVVPEYMLSHIESEVNKVFLGGITFTNQYSFVTDAGTNSVISEFHHVKIPIYMFMTTKKFSFWEVDTKQQTYKVTQKKLEKHPEKFVTYERIKFSHDRIPVDLLDYVVTENGVYTPEKIKKVFDKEYKMRSE